MHGYLFAGITPKALIHRIGNIKKAGQANGNATANGTASQGEESANSQPTQAKGRKRKAAGDQEGEDDDSQPKKKAAAPRKRAAPKPKVVDANGEIVTKKRGRKPKSTETVKDENDEENEGGPVKTEEVKSEVNGEDNISDQIVEDDVKEEIDAGVAVEFGEY